MMELKIIGHRGARRVTAENTIESFRFAAQQPVDAIEMDIRQKNGRLIITHDQSGDGPELSSILEHKFGKTLDFDIKTPGTVAAMKELFAQQAPADDWLVNSLHIEEIIQVKKDFPGHHTLFQTYSRPFKAIKQARAAQADGLTLTLYLLNPLTYRAAKRAGLKLLVYQNYLSFLLTWRWFVRFLLKLYPDIAIFTDRPDKIAPLFKK